MTGDIVPQRPDEMIEVPAPAGFSVSGVSVRARSFSKVTWILAGLFILLFPLAFINYGIFIDEGWLGQQVYSLFSHSSVTSDLFRDAPPLNGTIVIYHKLLIWLGYAFSRLFGWGLYSLRAVSLLSGLWLLLMLAAKRTQIKVGRPGLAAAVILAFTPIFFKQMIIFRPEMLLTVLGFTSFLLLERGLNTSRTWLIPLSGILAGLSGSAHAAGMAFAVAGFVVLLSFRKYRSTLWFAACAALAFFPYVSGWFTDHDLFVAQVFHNKLTEANLSLPWWRPLVDLIDEHKRWFRTPDVIGITVLFVLAALQLKWQQLRRNRIFWTYLLVLAVVIAAAPLPKMIVRYILPLTPFFALAIAQIWLQPRESSAKFQRFLRPVFVVWSVLFFAFGVATLGKEAFLHHNHEIADNHKLAESIPHGSLVMAPFGFVFQEQPNYTIQSFFGARYAADGNRSVEFLDRYADSLGVRFMIFSTDEVADWKLDSTKFDQSFTHYDQVKGTMVEHRWMMTRDRR